MTETEWQKKEGKNNTEEKTNARVVLHMLNVYYREKKKQQTKTSKTNSYMVTAHKQLLYTLQIW